MSNDYFKFKQFTIYQDRCAMKVTTDACLFGAWVASNIAVGSQQSAVRNRRSALDIGTGTGLLGLMLAQQIDMIVDAIEIDEDAFEQAKQNLAASPWSDNLTVTKGDANEIAHSLGKQYDIIISNPPFYENELEPGNEKKKIAHHSGGLLLTDLLKIIASTLNPQGQFYLLLPYKRHNEVEMLLSEHDLTISRKVLVKQSTRHDYFRIMLAGRNGRSGKGIPIEVELSIWDDQQQYTAEFVRLLKDYYLYL